MTTEIKPILLPILHDPFEAKSFGRIFVNELYQQIAVARILREIDPDELNYAPNDLIEIWQATGPNELVFLNRFEMCKNEIRERCLLHNIPVHIVDGVYETDGVVFTTSEAP